MGNAEPVVNDDLSDRSNVPMTASHRDYPFIVSIGKKGDKNGPYTYRQGHFCGGSLVTRKHIVTASHCFVAEKPSVIRVLVGIDKLKENMKPEIIDVENWKTYNDWEGKLDSSDDHDIAVVKLKRDFTSIHAQVIPLFSKYYDKNNIDLESIGWGTTETYTTSPNLLKIPLKIVPIKTCEEDLQRESGQHFFINVQHMCSRSTKKLFISTGDSGGPVIYVDNGVKKLIAVNEAQCSKSCSRLNTHTRIYYYIQFISAMIAL